MLVMPSTKQMASRMLDLPLPLRPVIELKLSSLQPESAPTPPPGVVPYYHPDITVRTAYDLKPCCGGQRVSQKKKSPSAPTSMISSVTLMVALSKKSPFSRWALIGSGLTDAQSRKADAQDTRRPSLQLWSYLFTFLGCRPAANWLVRGAERNGIYRRFVITVRQIERKLPVPSLPCSDNRISSDDRNANHNMSTS